MNGAVNKNDVCIINVLRDLSDILRLANQHVHTRHVHHSFDRHFYPPVQTHLPSVNSRSTKRPVGLYTREKGEETETERERQRERENILNRRAPPPVNFKVDEIMFAVRFCVPKFTKPKDS